MSRSATADWVGSDSPNKPQHYKVVANVMGRFLRPMHSGDYLARNVKLAKLRLSYSGSYAGIYWFPPQCVGPEHDH